MANKRFVFGILAVALVFGMLVAGCNTGDAWTPVTSLVHVDGTWKSSVKDVGTVGNLTTTTETERTLVVVAHGGSGSYELTTVVKVTYTGDGADADFWALEKQNFITNVNNGDVEVDEYTFDDSTKSVTTETVDSKTVALSQFSSSSLSPDGRTLLHGSVVYTKL